MKTLNVGLAAHIAEGVTTLSRCWKVVRRDGTVMGFTDHDLDLAFDGVTYKAASGFVATAIEDDLGLAVSNLDVQGALRSDALTEADLAGGRYDGAAVTIYLVNWSDVSQRVVIRTGSLGQVARGQVGFTSELRGLTAVLDQAAGRVFQRTCAWTLGDSRCTIDLTAAGMHGAGVVASVLNPLNITATGLSAFDTGFFERSKLTWASGANAGEPTEVTEHILSGTIATLTFMLPMGADIQVGDAFTITAGCDHTKDTCFSKFANVVNFGGFPDMPGNDFALSNASTAAVTDGSAIT